MNLIILAHKLEARHFFLNYSFTKINTYPHLFNHSKFSLFICQMGCKTAYDNLKRLLDNNNCFNLIINLGIAGAINNSLKLNSIYPIKTLANASSSNQNIQTPQGLYSCYTSEKKILTPIDAEVLKNFDLVDMEAYGLLQASLIFKIPFYSYKLVSDFPKNNTDDQLTKNNFDTYSKFLFEHFDQHILPFF